jgi:DNA repair exonuclease SbcCD ATPase subunit
MRLETLKLHNIGTFRDFEVDVTSMPGPLVAITGPNGAGKSTLLELGLPGAMYRQTPTRGSLV